MKGRDVCFHHSFLERASTDKTLNLVEVLWLFALYAFMLPFFTLKFLLVSVKPPVLSRCIYDCSCFDGRRGALESLESWK